MIVYNRYINSRDHTWYDSSNVLYSLCYDNVGDDSKRVVKVVFKQGRTYIYKDVDVGDYLCFKTATSTGSAFNEYIKHYDGVRLPDVDVEELDKLRESFINEGKITEEAHSKLAYTLEYNQDNKEFRLTLNGVTIYEGVDDHVSILKLLSSMNITCEIKDLTEPIGENDYETE
ncbi:MAG: KTSC domain-containing protein [Paludibacteraceae bacterium]|nr:KTSC domain-containing protein [Paludibacteraceae bacterium]